MIQIDPLDLAWLVGLLEGEGSFHLSKTNRNGNDYAKISLGMVDLDVIERAASLTQARVVEYIPKDHRQIKYSIFLNGLKAVEWMHVLYPHMGKRRKEQIEFCLEFTVSTGRGSHSKILLSDGQFFESARLFQIACGVASHDTISYWRRRGHSYDQIAERFGLLKNKSG